MCGRLARLALMVASVACLRAASGSASWTLARSEHFELYSQLDQHRTVELLNWFEQARAVFLNQSIVPAGAIPLVRVIAFASYKAYEPYRTRAFSDGSYARSGDRQYISMFAGQDDRRVAAHELVHALLSSSGSSLPLWLSEGLAEFFSGVRVMGDAAEFGDVSVMRRETLQRRTWIPLAELLALSSEDSLRSDRERGQMFYAQSWLLMDMLIASPRYGAQFQSILSALRSGEPTGDAFRAVYGESAEEIERDLRAWMHGRAGARAIRITVGARQQPALEISELDDSSVRPLLADMLAAQGELERAAAMLRELAGEQPRNARILAALGSVALQNGDTDAARRAWKQAIAQNLDDADIAYRYALLADAAALPPDEIRAALERAVALRPDFGDARYKLALLEKNAGRYDVAIAHLRAMHDVAPVRAYAYWSALADALNEVGRRSEAIEAAHQAAEHARTPAERVRAQNLAYVAETDFAVQFARDENGRAEMITTRVPHQAAGDWNPFIEAGDDVRIARGALREIECTGGATILHLDSGGAALTLTIADPSRVRMRNAPDELTCGPQQNVTVEVQYAASKSESRDGLVRGIDFTNP